MSAGFDFTQQSVCFWFGWPGQFGSVRFGARLEEEREGGRDDKEKQGPVFLGCVLILFLTAVCNLSFSLSLVVFPSDSACLAGGRQSVLFFS